MMRTDYRMMMAIRAGDIGANEDRSVSRSRKDRTGAASGRDTVGRYVAYAATASAIVVIASTIVF